ncbi:MAG: SprT family zinc-dependent metalloprotease [Fusicatenibacter sp.]|nr:SprT family zinc-dependent metalloprotease [Lachnospiraceae bacterium]MDY2937359.1 SprT family zinc-dependent metalloprotease [Fusicatenibacter sp.]
MDISYEIIYSARKTIALQIRPDGSLVVRAPKRTGKKRIEALLAEKQDWIVKSRETILRQKEEKKKHELDPKERARAIDQARQVLAQKTAFYAARMGVTYGRITVREQKTRWGSCSSAGNLNYNWKLVLMPEPVLDYVVVHELAHRKEMNHSPAFYRVVEQVLPDYRIPKKWLAEHGREY